MPRGDMEMCCLDLPSGTHCPAAVSAASGQPYTTSPCGGSLCAMIHPGGGIKAWSLDVSGQPWGAIFIPDPHGVSSGHLASDPAWSFPLPYPVSSLLIPQCWPQGHPCTHPSTKLHLSLHPREPACNMYQKTFQYLGRIFTENYWLHMYQLTF